jgi:hypothetical protein
MYHIKATFCFRAYATADLQEKQQADRNTQNQEFNEQTDVDKEANLS